MYETFKPELNGFNLSLLTFTFSYEGCTM